METEARPDAREATKGLAIAPYEPLAATTVLVAATVALGPVTGLVPIALASVLWALALVSLGWTAVRRIGSWSAWHWLFLVGTSAAVVRASALGLVQFGRGRDALFWNVDARYFATLAQGIARFGGLSDSLDYAGERVQYHAGSAWIAGALHGVLGLPVNLVLFVFAPAMCVTVIAVFGQRLLRTLGVSMIASVVAVVVALNLPSNPVGLIRSVLGGNRNAVLDQINWFLPPNTITLESFPLAIGFVAAWLLLERGRTRTLVVGAIALATLLVIKPQYLVGFGMIIGPVFLLRARRRRPVLPWAHIFLVGLGTAVAAGLFALVNPQRVGYTGIELDLVEPFRRLVDPANRSFTSGHLLSASLVVIAVIAVVPALGRSVREPVRAQRRGGLLESAVVVAVSSILVVAGLDAVTFLVGQADVDRAHASGLASLTRAVHDGDLDQAVLPITVVLVLLAISLLTLVLLRAGNWLRFVPGVVAVVLIVATLPITESMLRHPTGKSAREWAEEAPLARLLENVDTEDGVWLSSDLADSGEGFYRPLRLVNVTALSDAQHYIANVRYIGWTRDDVVERMRNMRRFFSRQWSPWHDRFLEEQEVRHVLVRDRCPPAWDLGSFPGTVVGTEGDWTLLRVGETGSEPPTEPPWPADTGRPQYGSVGCLTERVAP